MERKAFEFMDRSFDRNIIQLDQFEQVVTQDQLKPGDRFIVPPYKDCYNIPKVGISDRDTEYPILLTVFGVSDYHVHYNEFGGNRGPAVAWDLCYKLVPELV